MAKHISFPSIEQYRNVVKTVQERCRFHNVPLPKLVFHGTIKLHGTNSSVVFSDHELWAQSRSQVITLEADNAGFARFVEESRADLQELCIVALDITHAMDPRSIVILYGEWCGKGIQKGVGISQLDHKRFVIFAIRVLAPPEQESGGWLDLSVVKMIYQEVKMFRELENIDCIELYKTWELEIDMSFPQAKQNLLGELTLEVEQECPVAAVLGIKGVGEGIVWRCTSVDAPIRVDDLIFKVKGEKHSDTKVKVLAAVDLEKVQNIKEFVEKVVTDHRLEKGIDHLKASTLDVDVKNTGEFLKWVGTDVMKEEIELMTESGLDRKSVMGEVNKTARQWFMTYCNENL